MYVDIDVTLKINIVPGLLVDIVEDKNKSTQVLTRGRVKRLISNSDCKKGIKVELTNGAIGHCKGVPNKNEIKKDNFKFYNILFYQEYIYGLWDKKNKKFLIIERQNSINGQYENLCLLFSTQELAEEKIKGTSLDSVNYSIRAIRRKSKLIVDFFKDYNIDFYLIDNSRKLSSKRLKELEKKFKSF